MDAFAEALHAAACYWPSSSAGRHLLALLLAAVNACCLLICTRLHSGPTEGIKNTDSIDFGCKLWHMQGQRAERSLTAAAAEAGVRKQLSAPIFEFVSYTI